MIDGASPGLHDDRQEAAGELAKAGARVEHEVGEGLGEEAEGTLDVRLVLRAFGRRADAEGLAERGVDLGRVVGGSVVEQERERRRAGGRDAVPEGVDDGRGVLLASDAGAGEGARVRVDISNWTVIPPRSERRTREANRT